MTHILSRRKSSFIVPGKVLLVSLQPRVQHFNCRSIRPATGRVGSSGPSPEALQEAPVSSSWCIFCLLIGEFCRLVEDYANEPSSHFSPGGRPERPLLFIFSAYRTPANMTACHISVRFRKSLLLRAFNPGISMLPPM